jgi:hypothetical protein
MSLNLMRMILYILLIQRKLGFKRPRNREEDEIDENVEYNYMWNI